MRLAYADPPYPGKAHLYPENTEVDHAELIARLREYDGWALSTMSTTLASVLALCSAPVQVATWVRVNAPPFNPERTGAVRSWEPVVFSPARLYRDASDRVRDVFYGEAPSGFRQQAGLTGTKPRGFGSWVLALIGAEADDAIEDLFPGSGAVSREIDTFTRQLRIALRLQRAARASAGACRLR